MSSISSERVGFVLRAALGGGFETWHFPCRSLIPIGIGSIARFSSLRSAGKRLSHPTHVLQEQNLSAFAESSSFTSFIRRGWDSNPRYLAVYTLSKRALSTTQPPLRALNFLKNFFSISEHSFLRTPDFTLTLWFRCLEETTFIMLPQAPAFGSSAP